MSQRIAPKVPREEFTASTKRQAWKRCGGHCEGCGRDLTRVRHVYDHKTPLRLGGTATLANCQVLCDDGKGSCNFTKTWVEDLPGMAALKRYGKNRLPLDIDRPEHKPGSIQGRGFQKNLRKRMDGTVEKR